jgi:hypothetical protein
MSNQVFSNTNKVVPYYGDPINTGVITAGFDGAAPPVATGVTCAVNFYTWRDSINTATFMIQATQAGVNFGVGGTCLVRAPAGSIPIGFRPTFSVVAPFMLALANPPSALNALQSLSYIRINADGSFEIGRIDGSNNVLALIPANAQFGVNGISYYIGPIV